MVNIRDSQLRTQFRRLEADVSAGRTTEINADNMLSLLAAVGDRWYRGESSIRSQLAAPGITREKQLDIVRGGMSGDEKRDLGAILDQGGVPMTLEVKNFIEELIGRPLTQPEVGGGGGTGGGGNPNAPLKITGTQAGGLLQGTAAPGVTVEAINLSTAPEARLHHDDTFVVGKAGADGRFNGRVTDLKAGDVVRVRTRDAQGNTSDWVTVRASGLGADTRNTQFAIFRVGLEARADGKVAISNINASRPMSEPGAEVMFVNTRTGEQTKIKMDDQGNIPANTVAKGKAGDTFSIRVSDGTNNTSFTAEAGTVTVPGGNNGGGGNVGRDLPDPKLHKDETNADGTPRFSSKRFTGSLFRDSISPTDVKQGQIGDCYLPSAVAALAHANADALREMVKDNGDGTYTFTFKDVDYRGTVKNVPITVDGDLPVRAWGGPLYGSSAGETSTEKMELWWPLLEKAYAQWKGSYDAIGNGGLSSEVFEAVLGKPNYDMNTSWTSQDAVWNRIKTSIDNKLPVSAGTHGDDQAAIYTNTGVYADHSYSVLGYKEKDGKKYVTLRNPWGESEPFPGDGKNDGVFDLELSQFMKLYQTVMTVR